MPTIDLYGKMQRWQLYAIVLGVWILQMVAIPVWLRYYRALAPWSGSGVLSAIGKSSLCAVARI
jgi:hypothetical protein